MFGITASSGATVAIPCRLRVTAPHLTPVTAATIVYVLTSPWVKSSRSVFLRCRWRIAPSHSGSLGVVEIAKAVMNAKGVKAFGGCEG